MEIISKKQREFIEENKEEDINSLLLKKWDKDLDIMFCIRQIIGRKKAKEKFPLLLNYNLIYPDKIYLEQTSSDITANYKAELFNGQKTIRDLTSGFGIDDIYFSKYIDKVFYHERNSELAEIAKLNFQNMGIENIEVIIGDSIQELENYSKTDIIYLDPSRRDDNKNKVFLLKDCQPNIIGLIPKLFEKADIIAIKLSPMLEINSLKQCIDNIKQVHIVSIKNECKELFIILEKGYIGEIEYLCIDYKGDNKSIFNFHEGETQDTEFLNIEDINRLNYLYEPNSSIMKASGYRFISKKFNLKKLSLFSHLFLSNKDIDSFPGRKFIINEVLEFKSNGIKDLKKKFPFANISIRNFPLTVNEIRKKTDIKDGGEDYLFFTTIGKDKKIILICNKIISD